MKKTKGKSSVSILPGPTPFSQTICHVCSLTWRSERGPHSHLWTHWQLLYSLEDCPPCIKGLPMMWNPTQPIERSVLHQSLYVLINSPVRPTPLLFVFVKGRTVLDKWEHFDLFLCVGIPDSTKGQAVGSQTEFDFTNVKMLPWCDESGQRSSSWMHHLGQTNTTYITLIGLLTYSSHWRKKDSNAKPCSLAK